MGINVTTSKQQITASVAEDKISATVAGGFGATGPSGVINVTAPITNSGTTTAANVGLAVGTGLSVSGGSLIVTPGTYATLVNGTVPAEQLPSYVDDVLEYANVASFPVTGESGKIFVALNTGKCYRWSGSAYFEISTQPGNTDAVPEGSTNLYFTNARARDAFGSGTNGQVLTWSGGIWTAGNAYALPTATASVLGGVKIGSGVTITDGVISVSTNYAAASHTHAISDVTNLSTTLSGIDSALAGKLSSTDASVTNAREWTADTVSQAEAEAGTATTRRAWTALRVWQAIAAWWETVTVGTSKIANGAVTAAKIASAQDVSFKSVSTQGAGVGITPDEGVNAITVYYAGPPSFVVSDIGAITTGAWLGTRIGIAYGGTNATTASGARTNLGVAYGSTAGTVCQGNDARLSDSRSPTAHKSTHATGGSDALTAADIGASSLGHTHSAADISFASTDRLLGRSSSGAGAGEEITCTSAGRALLDDADAAAQRTTLGLGTAATSNTGDFATAGHTHAQLHDRSHAITSTSDHTATAWRVWYSNASGVVTELALGASGTVLTSGGASAAPTFGNVAYANMADPTVTSPSQITASQNDYASFARGINRFTTNGAYNITGMAAGSDGEVRVITNVGTTAANTLTIKDQSTSSTAANRFAVPWAGDCIIANGASVVVYYDNTTQRWRVV